MSAVWVPPGQQTFFGPDGKPLSLGTVQHFIPTTMTSKLTWADESQSVANPAIIPLDGAGMCTIWGSGLYRQILKDQSGTQIWDKLTGFESPSGSYAIAPDGPGDVSVLFQAAMDTGLPVLCTGGHTYLVKDLINNGVQVILNGATLKAAPGANWIMKQAGLNAGVSGGSITDPDFNALRSTTTTAIAAGGSFVIAVTSATDMFIGKLLAVKLTANRYHVTKIAGISGLNITLLDALPSGVSAGASVLHARGLVIFDGGLNCRAENLFFPVCASALELVATAGIPTTNDATIRAIRGYSVFFCGIFLDVDAAVCNFEDITLYGHQQDGTGYGILGYYQEGRNPGIYPTGGHGVNDVTILSFERGWQLIEPQLTTYIHAVGDTNLYEDWYIGPATLYGALQFGQMFAGAADKGIVFKSAKNIYIDGLYTNSLATAAIDIDADSNVWINETTWGPQRNTVGTGNINWFVPELFGGVVGKHAFEVRGLLAAANRIAVAANIAGFGPQILAEGSDANIPMYLLAKNAGGYFFQNSYPSGTAATQFSISGPASAVNYFTAKGGPTGTGATLFVDGQDANADGYIVGRGTGGIYFQNLPAGVVVNQFHITGPANTANWFVASGVAAGGNVRLGPEGSDTNIGISFLTKGSGQYNLNPSAFLQAVDDAAAAAAGVAVGSFYRNGSVVMTRVT